MGMGKKNPEAKDPDPPGIRSTLRDNAEEQLARAMNHSSGLTGQTAEALIHELQVHQIELETQAEELRRAHLALEESRDKYLDLYDFAPLGYLTLNDKALITDANLTSATLLGIERRKLLAAPFSKFLSEKNAGEWHRYFMDVLNREGNLACVLTLMRGDGSVFPARLEGIRMNHRTGEATSLRMAISDISEIRLAEDALRVANRKLNLLSGITRHDIRNQLVALEGYLEISKQSLDNPVITAEFIAKEEKIAGTIAHQISFTKDYEDLGIAAPVWQNISAVIKKVITRFPLSNIRFDAEDSVLEIFADPLLEKVFYNLIDNALRYGGEKMTAIRMTSRKDNGVCIIAVEDDGKGISMEDKRQLFTKGFGSNTGLGLYLSRDILSITGITITENGNPATGARFEIMVPKGMWRTAEDGRNKG